MHKFWYSKCSFDFIIIQGLLELQQTLLGKKTFPQLDGLSVQMLPYVQFKTVSYEHNFFCNSML